MLSQRIASLKNKLAPVEAQYLELQQQIKTSEKEQTKLRKEQAEAKELLTFQTECLEWTKQILEKRGEEHLQKITLLCSLALQAVFFDRTYEFLINVDDKRNSKNAYFVLREELQDGSFIETPFDALGGSIRAIIGLALQLYFIKYYKLFEVLYLDEALGSLSEAYVPSLMQFLREMSEETGLITVLISHDERVFEYVDKTYEIKNNTATLKV